ncbi:variant surface glycoprotein (VSG), putative [Trypanosoma brucei brucei TREU927]|uniref:Variant surface glycoprotein (VSG), putative n=1 Tax=Trypanosoma brucei brucei (strain 927/4 GUTat10.1) TaxID=185431 RepID=Q57X38_TRYB2|nr:variant surface glycoprotein (VSG), putative [Trypanosoma brucei brucei TREU927]AAX69823.1 variant surface glycoprotein (VSG), putative [Trypanosoma brucei]AAZ11577.1 variant surface glycoprotein (VSG), putative [Trypanosoma brucei brucei TREU927]
MRLAATLLILCLASAPPGKTTNNQPLKTTPWKNLCDVYAAFKDRMAGTKLAQQKHRQLSLDMGLQQTRTQILQQSTSDAQTRRRFAVLASYLSFEAAAARKHTEGKTEPAFWNNLENAAKLLGQIKEFLTIAAGPRQANTKGCITTNDGSEATGLKQGLTELAQAHGGCKAQIGDDPTGVAANDIIDDNGLKKYETAAPAQTTTGETGCKLLTLGNNNGYVDGTSLGTGVEVAGGLLKITPTVTNERKLNDLATNPGAGSKAAIAEAWKGFSSPTTPVAGYTNKGISALKTEQHFKLAFRIVYGVTPETTEKQLQDQIDTVFGKDPANFTNNNWKLVEEYTLPKDTAGKPAGTQLKEIKEPAVLKQILSETLHDREVREQKQQAELLEAKRQLQAQNKSETAKEAAEAKCNKIDKDTECKTPCKWNAEAQDEAKKCTLSEKGQKTAEKANQEGKGAKTTNTTGNNSFVIHKAPLLPAFFLR